jgi:hypothetical protein
MAAVGLCAKLMEAAAGSPYNGSTSAVEARIGIPTG